MTVRERLKQGDFNHMQSHPEPDGSWLITLTKRGDPHVYKMWARDLYQPNEQIVKEEVTEVR